MIGSFFISFSIFITFIFLGCGGGSIAPKVTVENPQSQDGIIFSQSSEENLSFLHKNIITTTFWIGESASTENENISNISSVWDDLWIDNYGGIDTPDDRNGTYPASFIPKENPFYFALPYNDFDENGQKRADVISYIPWATLKDENNISICKNRWIKIIKNEKIVYAQWEDVGPFGEADKAYVFGIAQPKNSLNNGAGLDVSPAVRDYLHLNGMERVDWQFVEEKDVPQGVWKEIVTVRNINWENKSDKNISMK